MVSRYLLFVLALAFSSMMACRTSPLPTGDGGGGSGGEGGGGGAGGSGGSSGGQDLSGRVCSPSASCSSCPNGVCCGNACCGKGEWCDPSTLTCRCGDNAGCTGGNVCATGPVFPSTDCGMICCGVTSFCPA
jgi:hypothetical protein